MSKLDSLPQLENGYTRIANEVMDALIRTRIPGEARQILDFIIRKTYGFGKKTDPIALSQFHKATGIIKPNIVRAIKQLQEMNIVIKKDNDIASEYSFNKLFTTWKPLSKKITLSKKIMNVIEKDNTSLSKKIHTKENTTKETIQKKESISRFPKEYLKNLPSTDIEEFYKKYEVNHDVIKMTAEKIILYCESKGKKYTNYRSTLQNWLLDKYGFRKTPIKERFDYVFDEAAGKYLQVRKQV